MFDLLRRLRIPLKPKHDDRLAAARRERNKHIPRRGADRLSFRQFWRKFGRTLKPDAPRAERRAIARRAYRALVDHMEGEDESA